MSLLLASLIVAGSCGGGREVQPRTRAAGRIVSLAPSVTEVLFDAGCGHRVVGVTSYCRYPPAVEGVARVGGYLTPSYETIVGLRPDVVVVLPEHEDARRHFTALGLEVVSFDHRHVAGILTSLTRAGQLCGTPEQAAAAVATLTGVLARVESRVSGRPTPRVILGVSRGGERGFGTLSAAGPGGIYDDLLRLAGGRNVVPSGPVLHPALSPENLIRLDPDVIVEFAPGADATSTRDEWQALSSLRSVRDRRVFVFTQDYLPVPGSRLVRFIATLADAVHRDSPGPVSTP